MGSLGAAGMRAGYGRGEVLRGVDLTVRAGDVTVLLGANGAGKSTTLRTLMGLLALRDGSVHLDGLDLSRASVPARVRAGMALVPEAGGVFRDFSVRENLQLGAFGVTDDALVAERMDQVVGLFPRLGERLRQQAATLSGGERQMLAIGRALMAGPHLLMLDEPFLGLSPAVVDVVVEALTRINGEQGVTLLVVEQSTRVLEVADTAYVMRLGEVVLREDDTRALREDPERLVSAFLHASGSRELG